LLENILTLEGEQRIGADIQGAATGGYYLDEIPIRDFLLQQMQQESKPIVDFCFTSASFNRVLGDAVNIG